MAKKAEKNTGLVWAKKDGYDKRQFTMQQLEAMGEDSAGGYDGWKVTQATKEPEEVTKARKQTTTTNTKDDGKDLATGEKSKAGAESTSIVGEDSAPSSEGGTKAS